MTGCNMHTYFDASLVVQLSFARLLYLAKGNTLPHAWTWTTLSIMLTYMHVQYMACFYAVCTVSLHSLLRKHASWCEVYFIHWSRVSVLLLSCFLLLHHAGIFVCHGEGQARVRASSLLALVVFSPIAQFMLPPAGERAGLCLPSQLMQRWALSINT